MQSSVSRVTDTLEKFVGKVKTQEPWVIAVGVTSVVVASGLFVWNVVLAPADGPKHMNDEQKALAQQSIVTVDSKTYVVRPISRSDISAASQALTEGHRNDKLLIDAASASFTPQRREGAMSWLFSTLLKATIPTSYGAVPLMTVGGEAAAVWLPRGADVSLNALLYHGAWQYFWRYSGWDRRGRFLGYAEACRANRKRIMKAHLGRYLYCLTAGVRAGAPSSFLSAVIVPATQLADRLGVPCYTELTDPSQRPVFESLGFKLQEETVLYDIPLALYVRQPVSASATSSSAGGAGSRGTR